MQAVSRESLRSCQERVEEIAAGSSPAARTSLAEELVSVSRVLAHEAVLRRALTDPARSPADRQQLITNVFGDHVQPATLDVLREIVAARWGRSHDLLDAIELLAVQVTLIAAEKGRRLPDVEDELFRFSRIVAGNPGLAAILGDPTAAIERLTALVDELLGDRARAETVRLVHMALARFGGRSLEAGLERLAELAAERRGRSIAYVRVAVAMSQRQEDRLGGSLQRIYDREMSLQVEVDESVMGGAIVRVGEDLYDGSVARRLADARGRLAH